MIAVSTFVADRPTAPSAARFGFRWGLGHSLAVLAVGAVLLVTGVRWPDRYDARGEILVGVMLVGLGVWALVSARKLHLHAPAEHGDHAHLHAHGPEGQHSHPHHHPHDGHGVTLVGVLHGLAGTSAVVALVPVTLVRDIPSGLAYLTGFGVGVTAGMMLYASVAAYAMRQALGRSLAWGGRLTTAVGLAGIGVGGWWIGTALLS